MATPKKSERRKSSSSVLAALAARLLKKPFTASPEEITALAASVLSQYELKEKK